MSNETAIACPTRETKGFPRQRLGYPTERAKVKFGTRRIAAIGIDDYAKSSPESWRL